MSAPKIKLYRLSRDFSPDILSTDRKSEINDELLPVKDKIVSAADIMANMIATGILPYDGSYIEKLTKIISVDDPDYSNSNIDSTTAILTLLDDSNSFSDSDSGSDSNSLGSNSNSQVLNSGRYLVSLDNESQAIYDNLSMLLNPCFNEGVYPKVYENNNKIPSDEWTYENIDGEIIITVSETYRDIILTRMCFYNLSESDLGIFCTKYAPVYNGRNTNFKPFLFYLKDGVEETYTENLDGEDVLDRHVSEYVFCDEEDYSIDNDTGIIFINNESLRDKTLFFKYNSTVYNGESYKKTKKFISESFNFVPQNEIEESGGHLYMGTDVFLGVKRYEPNTYTDPDTGDTKTMGISPAFVEPGNYMIFHREGSVVFPALVDSDPIFNTVDFSWDKDKLTVADGAYTEIKGSVYISCANICAIENVTEQIFEIEDSNSISEEIVSELKSGDTVFKPSSDDLRYLKSIGAPWVKRNNSYMPMRVFVTYPDESNSNSLVTELKPNVITISNYDELTIKT
jgi:hypothetical protein